MLASKLMYKYTDIKDMYIISPKKLIYFSFLLLERFYVLIGHGIKLMLSYIDYKQKIEIRIENLNFHVVPVCTTCLMYIQSGLCR